MVRRILFALPAAGLLVAAGAFGPALAPAFRILAALVFFGTLALLGWRTAGLLAPDAGAVGRSLPGFLVAVAAVTVPATLLGHFGALSPRALMWVVAAWALVTALLPGREPARGDVRTGLVEGVVLLLVAGAFAGLLIRRAADWRNASPGLNSYDDTCYHLPAIATWRTYGDLRMIKFAVGDGSPAFYPIAGELFCFSLLSPLDPSDYLARYSELPFALMSLVALFALSRRLGIGPGGSALAAILWAANPRFTAVAFSAGTDHVVSCFLLASVVAALDLAERRTFGRAALLGLALGLLAGTKYTGFLFLLPLAPIAFTALVERRPDSPSRWKLAMLGGGTALAVGGYTYARNLVATGNPIFPARVSLFDRTLLNGWIGQEGFASHPDARIDVWQFLLHRPDLLGVALPWLLVPAAIAAPLIALALRGPLSRRFRTAFVLALPVETFLVFRYLMLDHRDIRYFFGGVAIAGVAACWLIDRLPARVGTTLRAGLAAGALAVTVRSLGGRDLRTVFLVAVAVLVLVVLHRALRWQARTASALAAAAVLAVLLLRGPGLLASYARERFEPSPAAAALEERTRAAPATIAFVGSNQPYLWFGSRLQNRVVYVPTFATAGGSFFDVRSGLAFPHDHFARPQWLANLEREHVRFVVLERVGAELPEMGWIDAEPARFVPALSSGTTEVFEVRSVPRAPAAFALSAGSAHLSSYLDLKWTTAKGPAGEEFAGSDGAVLRLPPFEERVGAIRLELGSAPDQGEVSVRSCGGASLGRFAVDGSAGEVTLPVPEGFDTGCLTFGVEGHVSSSFPIGATGVRGPIPLRAISVGPWAADQTALEVGGARARRSESGYSLGVVSENGPGFADLRSFDVSGDRKASGALARFVPALRPGTIVLGAVCEDASGHAPQGAAALRSLGCAHDVAGRVRAAHAFIGVMGAAPGTVPEAVDGLRAAVAVPDSLFRLRRLQLVFARDFLLRSDPSILCSVDDPAEGAATTGALRVRGWCQERGGRPVKPVAFLVDGRSLAVLQMARKSRPDVAAAIPDIGDITRAGYEALVDPRGLAPGSHELVVRFETPDGRYRLYEPRRFRFGR